MRFPGSEKMASNGKKRLSAELEFYVAHKREWLETHQGQYVVVQDDNVIGFYSEFEEAFSAGIAEFGVRKDFLVKQVLAQDPVYFIY